MLFQAGVEQLVLYGHATKDFAIGELLLVVTVVRGREDVAYFEPPSRAQDHAAMARIPHGIHGCKTPHLPHGTDAD
jgi:hypothetical protein